VEIGVMAALHSRELAVPGLFEAVTVLQELPTA
jgi:hypothetical protein